jgi:hypothetical protein
MNKKKSRVAAITLLLALATIQAKAKNFACNQRFLLCLI